jgi:hypothetical protein
MTREDTAKLLAIMKVAWPRFYIDATLADVSAAISFWHDMLQEYDPEPVYAAMKQTARESPFPPTVADIIKRLEPIKQQMDFVKLAAKQYQAALASGEIGKIGDGT